MPDQPATPGAGSNLPATRGPLDRAALERVLARAAELQLRDHDPADATLTEEQIVEVGREVGLAPEHIRQALAEERMRVALDPEDTPAARVFGPAIARASRMIHGDARRVLERLDSWMQNEECLSVKRAYGERITWEPRGGFMSELRRGLNLGGRGYHLAKAKEVAATAVAADANRVLVRLEADLGNVRVERITGGSVMAGGGAIAAGTLLVLGFFPLIAIAPAVIALGGGYAVARSHAPVVQRAQLALEQVLDRMERNEEPPRRTLLGQIGSLGSLGASVKIIKDF